MRSKQQKAGIIFFLTGLLLLAVCFLKPRYDAFVQDDYKTTCQKAMQMITIYYHCAIREEIAIGMRADEIDYEDLLRQVVEKRYALTLNEDFSSDNFCRAGGHVQIRLDPVTHAVSMSCDYPGHNDHYIDEVFTNDMMEELKNFDSGLDIKK